MSNSQDTRIWLNRPFEEGLELEKLVREALDSYKYELREKVSMLSLYRADQEMWWNIVNDVDPDYAYRKNDIKSRYYSQKFKEYHRTTAINQKRFDAFVLYMEDNATDSLVAVLGLSTTEDFCRSFGVDRQTALKMKSICEGVVIVDHEWLQIKSYQV